MQRSIPNTIVQTNEKDQVPEGMAAAMKSIIDANSDYDYRYFDNARCREFLRDHFPERVLRAYDKIRPGAYKADLFRYCYLYEKGGVYIDSGMVAILPLRDVIRTTDTFVSPEDNNSLGIYNAFIACIPKHPILEKAMELTLQNIEDEYYGDGCLAITGPAVLAKAFESIVGKSVEPDRDYQNGIRLIRYVYKRYIGDEPAAAIFDGPNKILRVKYPGYYQDCKWYNTGKHYSLQWDAREVFERPKIDLKIHQKQLLDLFSVFIVFAKEHGLKWWANGGTLLGAIRERGLIPWDDDVDIDAPTTTILYLKSKAAELRARGYKFILVDHIWRFKYTDSSKPAFIDIFEVVLRPDGEWRYTESENQKRWPNSYFRNDELFPLKTYDFSGLKINGAQRPEPYLQRQYGDWRTPQPAKGHFDRA